MKDLAIKQLQILVSNACDKVQPTQVAGAVAEVMPDIVRAMHEMALSSETSQADRRWAIGVILSLFVRCTTTDIRVAEASAKKATATATRVKASAAVHLAARKDKNAKAQEQAREHAAQRRRADKILASVRAKKQTSQTGGLNVN